MPCTLISPSYASFIKTVLILLLLLNTLFVIYLYATHHDHHDDDDKVVVSESHVAAVEAAVRQRLLEDGIVGQLHPDLQTTTTTTTAASAVRSSNVGAGKAFHDHDYEMFHYEFILDSQVGSWVRYPNKGGLPCIETDRLMYYTLCCVAKGSRVFCQDRSEIESEIVRDFDTKEYHLSVLIRDSNLESRPCVLTYTLDKDKGEDEVG